MTVCAAGCSGTGGGMVGFDVALARVLDVAKPLGRETVPFAAACGRVTADPVTAALSMPREDVSAMDGYAVRDADLGEIPFSLPVVGESAAGSPPGQVLPERAAFRIFTGAPVPDGATRVIVQENTERNGDYVRFVRPPGAGTNIRRAGSDFRAGDKLTPKGVRLDWRWLTTAAAADRGELVVYRRPGVVILATGDELAAPGEARLRAGAIPESVSCGIAALAGLMGAVVLRSERLPDDPVRLAAAAGRALEDADVVVVIGGASVGDRDYSRGSFGSELDYVFPKVAIRPGKPVWLARARDRLVIGLPGNPASALVTARLFLAPLLAGLGGQDTAGVTKFAPWRLAGEACPAGDRETFLRAVVTDAGAMPLASQDSSNQSALGMAGLLIRRRAGAPVAKEGEMVEALAF